jgi:RNA polymerase primary sigma factor
MRSVERFDVETGNKFSTYACRAIIQAMSREKGKIIRRLHLEMPNDYDLTPESRVDPTDYEQDEIQDLKETLDRNLADLNDDERFVIYERFFSDKKLHEVGKPLAVTKERVRQIQNKALNKLRTVLVPAP